jgi:hypothetical protein
MLVRDRTTTELVVDCATPERNLAHVAAAAPFSSTGFFGKERGLGLGFPVFCILFSSHTMPTVGLERPVEICQAAGELMVRTRA